jgi:hypothetical protein
MNSYPEGSLVQFQNIFRDDNGYPVDPEVVTFTWETGTLVLPDDWTPSGPPSTPITYSGATSPAVGTLARYAAGHYLTWVNSTGVANENIGGKWVSTGAGQAAKWDYVYIQGAPF